jgi:hypothetical protein
MAVSQNQRLRRLAEKASRRKGIVAVKRMAENSMDAPGDSRCIVEASRAPILTCLAPEGPFDEGMGTVVLARTLPGGLVGAAFFLVDTWCLGVKDAFFRAAPRHKFEERIDFIRDRESLADIDPSVARKLLHDAVDYAASLELSPSPHYYSVEAIFGDVPMAAEKFTFGKDGKPFYMSGPNDSPARIREVMNALRRSAGDGNFEFIANIAGFA